jgi:hypothetical protein
VEIIITVVCGGSWKTDDVYFPLCFDSKDCEARDLNHKLLSKPPRVMSSKGGWKGYVILIGTAVCYEYTDGHSLIRKSDHQSIDVGADK